MAKSKINIKKSKRGTFTRAAKKRGMGVQEFASKVLANKDNYSSSMVKKANFARNATKWEHDEGGMVNAPQFFLGGAIQGASTGAAIGGPWGAAIGGVLGGGAELFGKSKQKNAQEEALEKQKAQQASMSLSQQRMANLEPNQQYAPTFKNGGEIDTADVIKKSKGSKAWEDYPIVGDPLYYASQYSKMTKDKDNYKVGKSIPFKEAVKKDPILKDIANAVPINIHGGVPVTDKRTGKTHYFPTFEKETFNKYIREQGYDVFANGGEVERFGASNQYARNIDNLDRFLWDNYLGGGDLGRDDFTDEQAAIYNARYDLLNEVPSTAGQIKDADLNKMKYLNSIMSRLNPHMTQENAEILGKSNAPWNIPKKIGLVKDMDYYKNDLDSIQKYMPEFYDKYNLGMAEPFLKEGDIPEYSKGGKMKNKYACGGKKRRMQMGGMTGMPNAELEGGESIELPNGEGMSVEGPSHAQGGVDMNLPGGTEVYSDRLKVPGTEKTFSEANKELLNRMSRYEKTLDSPNASSLAKRTAKKMLAKLEMEQDQLFQTQQQMNGDSNGQQSEFQDGGMTSLNPFKDPQFNVDTSTLVPTQMKDTSGMKQYNPGILGKLSASGGSEGLGGALGGIASVAPALYNIGRGIFGNPKEYDSSQFRNPYEATALNRMRNRTYNVDPEIEAARNASRIARSNVRNAARTRGELLGAYAPISAAETRAMSQAYANKQNIENQYAAQTAGMEAQLGQQRAATELQVSDMNARSRAARRNMLGTGLSQLSQYAQIGQQRKNLRQADALRAQAFREMFPNFGDDLLTTNN